jgi:hypothetical protein
MDQQPDVTGAATAAWPELVYETWQATRDTLHAHTQVLGKLCVQLAPPEPQWQHTALRLTARGYETPPLPSPSGVGAVVVALDLPAREAVVEHTHNGRERIPLTPHRSVASVTRAVVAAVHGLAGPVQLNMTPQETPWTLPLDEDDEHATFEPLQVDAYFAAATTAAQVLAALRAPYRGRSTPVNAWWGSFDLAVGLFSGRSAEPPSRDLLMRNAMDSEEIAVGWWPGDHRYRRAAFYAYAHPMPPGFRAGSVSGGGGWNAELGEFVLDWDDVIASPDPWAAALDFAVSVATHGCEVCSWNQALAASLTSSPPPIS